MTALIDRSTCSALLITCSDFRFKSAEGAFAQTANLADDYDLIARPGAIRSLVEPRSEAARDTMVEEILLLSKLHQFSRVVMLNHRSCRAYDDLATVENEVQIHTAHLRAAVGVVEGMIADVKAEPYLVGTLDKAFDVTKV
jgi:hypothetical protein